jgi:hypothetical protein
VRIKEARYGFIRRRGETELSGCGKKVGSGKSESRKGEVCLIDQARKRRSSLKYFERCVDAVENIKRSSSARRLVWFKKKCGARCTTVCVLFLLAVL